MFWLWGWLHSCRRDENPTGVTFRTERPPVRPVRHTRSNQAAGRGQRWRWAKTAVCNALRFRPWPPHFQETWQITLPAHRAPVRKSYRNHAGPACGRVAGPRDRCCRVQRRSGGKEERRDYREGRADDDRARTAVESCPESKMAGRTPCDIQPIGFLKSGWITICRTQFQDDCP